jgi:hypothetical protein
MTGELIPTGVTYGVGRNSINDAFSGTAYMNNISLDSGGNFSAGTGGGIIYSGGTDLYNIFCTDCGSDVPTGGTATSDIKYDLGSTYNFRISGSSSLNTQVEIESNFVSGEPASLQVGKGASRLFSESGTTNAELSASGGGVSMIRRVGGTLDQGINIVDSVGNPDFTIIDAATLSGIKYFANYHANYTNRTLVDKEYVDNVVATATTSGGGVEEYVNVGSTGTSFTWNVSGDSTNYEVTLTGATTTLNLTGVRNGEYGTIIVKQDTVGGRLISLGTVNGGAATHRVANGGGGAVVLTSNPNAIDILTFTYNGSAMYWSVGNDYT